MTLSDSVNAAVTCAHLRIILLAAVFCSCAVGPVSALDFDRLDSGIFRIINIDRKGDTYTGTGFLISNDGVVATNFHVVENAQSLYVVQRRESVIKVWHATVVRFDNRRDLAVIRAKGVSGTPFVINKTGAVKGSDVYALGFPGQADNGDEVRAFLAALRAHNYTDLPVSDQYDNFVRSTVKKGNVEDVRMTPWGHPDVVGRIPAVLHNASITHGNSGGPLIDSEERVVGVNTLGRGEGNVKVAGGEIIQAGNVLRFSSASSELIAVLDTQGLRYSAVTTGERPIVPAQSDAAGSAAAPPVTTPAPAPAAMSTPKPGTAVMVPPVMPVRAAEVRADEPGIGKSPGTFMIGAILAVVAVCGVLGWLVPRFGGRSQPVAGARLGDGPPLAPRPAPASRQESPRPETLRRTPAADPAAGRDHPACTDWQLVGKDLEGRQHKVKFDAAEFARFRGRLLIGRSRAQSQLIVDNSSLSRTHAELRWVDSTLRLVDRNSSNGTKVNGRALEPGTEEAAIHPGDVIDLGEVSLILNQQSPP